jgi:cytochrome c
MKRFGPAIACTIAFLALGACSKPQPETDKAEESASPETESAEPAEADEPADYDDLKGDVAAGAMAFAQCKVCHAMEEGKTGIGPSLHKTIGRTAGSIAGYAYSPAMKSSGITWTEDKIFTYLEKPQAVVPGTKMSFAGYSDPQKRADVIAWIKANGGS